MQEKEWYKSKSMWAGIIIGIVGIANYYQLNIPTELIIYLANALGIVGIRAAVSANKK